MEKALRRVVPMGMRVPGRGSRTMFVAELPRSPLSRRRPSSCVLALDVDTRLHSSGVDAAAGRGTSGGSQDGRAGGNRRQRMAVMIAGGAVGMSWLMYEERKGRLSGGLLEPLTLRVAALVRGSRAAMALLAVMSDYKWSLWGLEKGSEEYTVALAGCHSRAALEVLTLCRQQAGVYIKAGQFLASLRPVLPRQFTDTLAQLCDDAPQSPMHDVRRVVREETGAELEALFARFDPTPVGCASLAQVHRAWLKSADDREGNMVAVKVQHAWMSMHTRA